MLRRPLSLTLIVLVACGPGSDSTSDTDATDATTQTSTDTSDTGVTTTTAPTSSATDPTDPGTTTTATTTTDSTTGEATLCNGWETADGAPYLVLHDRDGNELSPGSTLPLECGGQGQFMFGVYPTFGGFTPPGDIIDFKLVVDVDGFNNNPEGHFYSADPVGYYISCDPILGGVSGVLPVFPFDNLDDLTALDGKPAHVQVTLPTGDVPVVVDVDVVLAVVKDDSWGFCGG
jgi:hypothetical protein